MKRYLLIGLAVVGVGAVAVSPLTRRGDNTTTATEAPPTFLVDPAWPSIPNGWVFGQTSGLAIDERDHVWILQRPRTVAEEDRSRAAPAVLEFDAEGVFVQGWGGPGEGYEWPNTEHGIFLDHRGFVWIAGSGAGDDQLLKFTRDGRFVMQIGRAGQSRGNTDRENFNRPADVFVHAPTDEVYVADGYGNRRVIVFDAETGAFKRMWGAFGRPPTDPVPGESVTEGEHFNLVHGVRISNDDLVYVSDRGGRRLQVFNLDGGFVTEEYVGRVAPDPDELRARADDTAFSRPVPDLISEVANMGHSVIRTAFSPDPEQRYLYIGDRSNQRVVIYDRATLEPLSSFGRTGNAPGEFFILHDMVTDSRGNLYTAEVNQGSRAQRFVLQRGD